MTYQKPITQLIASRSSCRTFDQKPIDREKLAIMTAFLNDLNQQARSKIRFVLISSQLSASNDKVKLGTYGFISGASNFMAAVFDVKGGDPLELGYLFEKAILKATDLDLGTVWLGGSFNRSDFEKTVSLGRDELIAIVSPIGIAKEKRSIKDAAIRLGAGSDHRKPWSELFFDQTPHSALTKANALAYAEVLDMVRVGPSASNKQPWRIIKANNDFHLFLARTAGYAQGIRYDMQLNDLGIAQCHFELTAAEIGLKGSWRKQDPQPDYGVWEYVLTWVSAA